MVCVHRSSQGILNLALLNCPLGDFRPQSGSGAGAPAFAFDIFAGNKEIGRSVQSLYTQEFAHVAFTHPRFQPCLGGQEKSWCGKI